MAQKARWAHLAAQVQVLGPAPQLASASHVVADREMQVAAGLQARLPKPVKMSALAWHLRGIIQNASRIRLRQFHGFDDKSLLDPATIEGGDGEHDKQHYQKTCQNDHQALRHLATLPVFAFSPLYAFAQATLPARLAYL